MKRYAPYFAFVAGIAVFAVLLPRFNGAQPRGVRITRHEAVDIADAEARRLGIPVDQAWSTLSWISSPRLAKELQPKPELRRQASADPVLAPRLGAYHRVYYRRGLEKYNPYGYVNVDGRTGQILGARLSFLSEDRGAQLPESALRAPADAFVHSRVFVGAPAPRFESARPTVLRSRTDWTFRYRVPTNFPLGRVVPYLYVFYAGDRFAGWDLAEEYADGSPYRGADTEIWALFARFVEQYALLVILLVIFLRKYHAGEVGVGTGSILFAVAIVLALIVDWIMGPSATEGNQIGSLDARVTALANMGFKFLLYDIPLAVLVFFAWSVGESYARERWGERLASFDALLRRDALNATVGRSLLHGVLAAPVVAAAAFLTASIPLLLTLTYPSLGIGSEIELSLGGPVLLLLFALGDAILFSVCILFLLAWTHRGRMMLLGVAAVIVIGMLGGGVTPTEPYLHRMMFEFGGIGAAVLIFLASDLLTTAVAIFGGAMLAMSAPLLSVARGHEFGQLLSATSLPLVALVGTAIAALLTKREVIYRYEDLAPHVRRIIERERVKAEIDAANRIQSALLPVAAPRVAGASVASHYRAATEIGGDYFDFLPQRGGEIGIAFGDVAGHGLTSGIVMAMAKSALLVQVETDPSPRTVMQVLNEIVIRTAPRRMMMTFFFGLLDPSSQRLRFSSAGHLDPYAYRARQHRLEPLSSWGFPLGVRRRDPFREHIVQFAPGDRLVLYSDGLIEALDDDGEPFGFDRFERVLLESGHLGAEEIKKTLLGSIRKFTRNRPPEDDQTLVVVSFDTPAAVVEEAEAEYAAAT